MLGLGSRVRVRSLVGSSGCVSIQVMVKVGSHFDYRVSCQE